MRPVPRIEGLVVGVSLLAVGVLWTLSNLNGLDLLATLRTYWPLTLVSWGALEIYNWRALSRPVPPPPAQAEARWFDESRDDAGRPE